MFDRATARVAPTKLRLRVIIYDVLYSTHETNPSGPEQGIYRIVRGGSFANNAVDCRTATRVFCKPDDLSYYTGFRVVKRSDETDPLKSYSIQGKILENGSGLSDCYVYIEGWNSDNHRITDSLGKYVFSELLPGTYTIIPFNYYNDFNPSCINVTINDADVIAEDIIALPKQNEYPNITFATIPGGTFRMGDEDGSLPSAMPVHTVIFDGFEMSITEITNAHYAQFLNEALVSEDVKVAFTKVIGYRGLFNGLTYLAMDYRYIPGNKWITFSNGSFNVAPGKENLPVICVTRIGAKAFALYYGFDLPTEAEWEYAARGGAQFKYGTDDGTLDILKANYSKSNNSEPVKVGSYPDNPFGLYDMAGNVFEFCHDWYGNYGNESETNPAGPDEGTKRVVRGGSWANNADDCRAAVRAYSGIENYSGFVGFRVVRRPGGVTY